MHIIQMGDPEKIDNKWTSAQKELIVIVYVFEVIFFSVASKNTLLPKVPVYLN